MRVNDVFPTTLVKVHTENQDDILHHLFYRY